MTSIHTVPLNYNFIFTHVYTRGNTINILNDPVTWLRGPCFLVAWIIQVPCNSSCATRGIVMHGIIMRGIVTCETGHARDSHEWNTRRHKRAINIHYLTYKNMSNSVHNCESRSRMNYQRNGIIVHV